MPRAQPPIIEGQPWRKGIAASSHRGRSRNAHYWAPPPQIRTCGVTASGSCLRWRRLTNANRMRSNTGKPCFRRGVRDLSFSSSFPLTSRLPSTDSAPASGAGLFAGFFGTTQLSDFRLSFIIGVRLWLPDTSRLPHLGERATIGSLGSCSICISTCTGSATTRGLLWARLIVQRSVAFDACRGSRHPDFTAFVAQYPTYAFPCQRFVPWITPRAAWLGASLARYALAVVDFHLQHINSYPTLSGKAVKRNEQFPLPTFDWLTG